MPGLSEFHWEDYSFQGKVIQNMELLVLTTLEWNMDIVTPFAFLHYFVTKLCSESPPSPIFSKTIQLIVATMKGEKNELACLFESILTLRIYSHKSN